MKYGWMYFSFAKYLYGLRQAARMFYDYIVILLTKLGFKMSEFDKCLFVKDIGNGNIVDVCVHVDDLFITAPNQQAFDEISKSLKSELDVDVKSKAPYSVLGMNISRNLENCTAKITMKAMINKLIDKYIPGMPAKYAPYNSNLMMDEFNDADTLSPKEQEIFASSNMAILYVSR
jgi:hypothetical protein